MVDLPDTSDIGMMYRNILQQQGVPLTNENMNRVAEHMRGMVTNMQGTSDLIPGLSVQAQTPPNIAGATPPPNIAGASAQNSGQAPPMRAPAPPPLPPLAQAPPQLPSSPSGVGMRGPEAGMPVSPAQVAQMVQRGVPYGLPGQTAPMGPQNADLSPATPPPGAAPTASQSQPPPPSQPLTAADIAVGLGGLGAGGAALYATRNGARPTQPFRQPLPMPSSAGEQIAPGSAQNQRPVGPTTQGPPPPAGTPPEPIRPGATQPFRQSPGNAAQFPTGSAAGQRPVSAQPQGPPPAPGKPPEPLSVGPRGAPPPVPPAANIARSIMYGDNTYGLGGTRPVGPPQNTPQVGPTVAAAEDARIAALPPALRARAELDRLHASNQGVTEAERAANIAAWEQRMRGGKRPLNAAAAPEPNVATLAMPPEPTATSPIGNIIAEEISRQLGFNPGGSSNLVNPADLNAGIAARPNVMEPAPGKSTTVPAEEISRGSGAGRARPGALRVPARAPARVTF